MTAQEIKIIIGKVAFGASILSFFGLPLCESPTLEVRASVLDFINLNANVSNIWAPEKANETLDMAD